MDLAAWDAYGRPVVATGYHCGFRRPGSERHCRLADSWCVRRDVAWRRRVFRTIRSLCRNASVLPFRRRDESLTLEKMRKITMTTYQVVQLPGSTATKHWGIVVTYADGAQSLSPAIYATEAEAQAEVDRFTAQARPSPMPDDTGSQPAGV